MTSLVVRCRLPAYATTMPGCARPASCIGHDPASVFASIAAYRARLPELHSWAPHLHAIAQRHGLDAPRDVRQLPRWRTSFESERQAPRALAADPQIAAPQPLASGELFPREPATWPYLVMTRMPGVPSGRAGLTDAQWHRLAAELGRPVRRLHALVPRELASITTWPPGPITATATTSSLPPHLVAQVGTPA